jgi:hypothetical protein
MPNPFITLDVVTMTYFMRYVHIMSLVVMQFSTAHVFLPS